MAMDAIALLKQDHKTVERLFKEFEKLQKRGGTAAEKKKVVSSIIKELSVHAAIEEEIFYPDVREQDSDSEDTVLESLEEHHIVKWTCSELQKMSPTDERYDAKVTVLMESVRHHVKEEETELFPEVRKALGRKTLAEMGERLEKLKTKVPKKPTPRAPDTPPGNKVAHRTASAAGRLKAE
jgi:hemerythrin superfamily protein